MFIVYAVVVEDDGCSLDRALLAAASTAEVLLFLAQALVIYWMVRRRGLLQSTRSFAGARAVGRATGAALPVLAVPVVILGGIFGGVFTFAEAASVALLGDAPSGLLLVPRR